MQGFQLAAYRILFSGSEQGVLTSYLLDYRFCVWLEVGVDAVRYHVDTMSKYLRREKRGCQSVLARDMSILDVLSVKGEGEVRALWKTLSDFCKGGDDTEHDRRDALAQAISRERAVYWRAYTLQQAREVQDGSEAQERWGTGFIIDVVRWRGCFGGRCSTLRGATLRTHPPPAGRASGYAIPWKLPDWRRMVLGYRWLLKLGEMAGSGSVVYVDIILMRIKKSRSTTKVTEKLSKTNEIYERGRGAPHGRTTRKDEEEEFVPEGVSILDGYEYALEAVIVHWGCPSPAYTPLWIYNV
ncbi:hypothetical protein BDQ17DRAFT_1336130 [Cyathus striatus]|nr:hypothetical protein BDQ17DRAFT_1336130 [Cyathus striatus]